MGVLCEALVSQEGEPGGVGVAGKGVEWAAVGKSAGPFALRLPVCVWCRSRGGTAQDAGYVGQGPFHAGAQGSMKLQGFQQTSTVTGDALKGQCLCMQGDTVVD